MQTVAELGPRLGVAPTCAALDVARSSFYRQLQPRLEPRPRPTPPRARGPKAKPVDPRDRKIAEQAREIARLAARLERAEGLIEVQKKVSQLLGIPLASDGQG